MIKKLGVNFGDNDFYYTFENTLKTVMLWRLSNKLLENCSKDKLTHLINSQLYPSYLMGQNSFEYNGLEKGIKSNEFKDQYKSIKEYLCINKNQVFVNKEVDDFLSSDNFFNGEFFFIDERLNFGSL